MYLYPLSNKTASLEQIKCQINFTSNISQIGGRIAGKKHCTWGDCDKKNLSLRKLDEFHYHHRQLHALPYTRSTFNSSSRQFNHSQVPRKCYLMWLLAESTEIFLNDLLHAVKEIIASLYGDTTSKLDIIKVTSHPTDVDTIDPFTNGIVGKNISVDWLEDSFLICTRFTFDDMGNGSQLVSMWLPFATW